jgi:hypothetical protein
MADWPLLGDGQSFETGGTVSTGNSTGTSITGHASTAHSKGSITELIAATAHEAVGIILHITCGSSPYLYLMDVMVGAAGYEVVLIPDILYQPSVSGTAGADIFFPVSVAAGTRISARCQASDLGKWIVLSVTMVSQGFKPSQPFTRVTAYGVVPATSRGVSVDPGGTNNTKGAYSEIVAATTNPMGAIIVILGGQANAAMALSSWLFDVSIGPATETILLPDFRIRGPANGSPDPWVFGPYPCAIPAATRISIRSQCTQHDAAARLLDFAVYGLD